MAEPRYRTNPNVIYTKLDDAEAVLLDVQTQMYYSVNETGLIIWELLGEPRTIEEIVAALTEDYEVEAADAQRVAETFVQDLGRDGLVRTH